MLRLKLKAHRLKDPILRKIRSGLRSILLLEYKKKELELRKRLSFATDDQKEIEILKQRHDLSMSLHRSPINCFFYGNHMGDLVQDPDSLFWYCPHHIP